MQKNKLIYFCLLGLIVAACTVKAVGDPEKPITIKAHVIIDVRELKETAVGIEDMIAKEAALPGTPAKQPTRLSLLSVASKWFEPKSAYAEGGYDLKEITPSIQLALNKRKSNYNKLMTLKSVGSLGENNEGLVTSFTDDADVNQLAASENKARNVIYQAIVEQNHLDKQAIHTVRSVFAEVQRKKAKPGEKIQLPNGSLVNKS